MTGKVLILGAKGRFGRAARSSFYKAGWDVLAFGRNWPDMDGPGRVISGDAFDKEVLIGAAMGCDVIVNALNPPYPKWTRDLPRLTEAVIAAAKASGATVLIPGNVYNYGEEMPPLLTEATPHKPTTRKGTLREEMEERFAQAGDEGVQTIILRAGDFIEAEKTGNWFDTYVAAKVGEGKLSYPGPLDRMHAWAYLPDMARAAVGLAEKRARLGTFCCFGFESINLTGAELIATIETVTGQSMKVSSMPWPIIRLLSVINPMMREVVEMAYLWRVPHAIDGRKLSSTLPDFEHTPIENALTQALGTTPQIWRQAAE